MKSIIVGLIFAFMGLAAPAFTAEKGTVTGYTQKDTVPEYGTPEWAAYVKADKESKAAKDGTLEGYLKAAAWAVHKWSAAWHYYNAGKLEWVTDPEQAEVHLKLAEKFMDEAKVNVPTSGPNTPENLKKAVASIRKAIEDAAKEKE